VLHNTPGGVYLRRIQAFKVEPLQIEARESKVTAIVFTQDIAIERVIVERSKCLLIFRRQFAQPFSETGSDGFYLLVRHLYGFTVRHTYFAVAVFYFISVKRRSVFQRMFQQKVALD